jgi:hypothetical protein
VAKTASRISDATATVDDSNASNDQLRHQNAALKEQVQYLREQVDLLKRHIFGHKSEKLPPGLMVGSIDLFGADPVATPATVQIPGRTTFAR